MIPFKSTLKNVIEIVLRSNELRSKLKFEIQIVGWSEGVATMTAEQSYMVAVAPVGYIGTKQAKIDLLKCFFYFQSKYRRLCRRRKVALRDKHWFPFCSVQTRRRTLSLHNVHNYVNESGLFPGAKVFIISGIERFDILNVTTASTPEGTVLLQLNFEQIYASTETLHVLQDFQLKRPSLLGCPTYIPSPAEPAGTGMTGCVTSILSTLFSSSKTSPGIHRIGTPRGIHGNS